tara:strand:+ start:24770 stop:25102 length:333 start_codon:yes stop_codon:yes gene_type:complete
MAIIQANDGSIWDLDGIQAIADGDGTIVVTYANGNAAALTYTTPPFIKELAGSSDDAKVKKANVLTKAGEDAQLANCTAAIAIGGGAEGIIVTPGYMVLQAVELSGPAES